MGPRPARDVLSRSRSFRREDSGDAMSGRPEFDAVWGTLGAPVGQGDGGLVRWQRTDGSQCLTSARSWPKAGPTAALQ